MEVGFILIQPELPKHFKSINADYKQFPDLFNSLMLFVCLFVCLFSLLTSPLCKQRVYINEQVNELERLMKTRLVTVQGNHERPLESAVRKTSFSSGYTLVVLVYISDGLESILRKKSKGLNSYLCFSLIFSWLKLSPFNSSISNITPYF